ncbi:hypothetical protein ACFQ0M_40055 [Kitasatospora aburaviensis]
MRCGRRSPAPPPAVRRPASRPPSAGPLPSRPPPGRADDLRPLRPLRPAGRRTRHPGGPPVPAALSGLPGGLPGRRAAAGLRRGAPAGPAEHGDATAFAPGPGSGPFRYRCWLPTAGRALPEGSGGATYRAERLGRALGLTDLWVAFSGYWPERGAALATGSFKELEAQAVLARLPERPPVLVVASAGNTAAAFLRACSQQGWSACWWYRRRRCPHSPPPANGPTASGW